MYGITFSQARPRLDLPIDETGVLPIDRVTLELLESLRQHVVEAVACRLSHPSGRTYCGWLNEIAFSEVIPSHSGASFAGEAFDRLSEEERPRDISAIDSMLRPAIDVVVEMRAPLAMNPRITAIK